MKPQSLIFHKRVFHSLLTLWKRKITLKRLQDKFCVHTVANNFQISPGVCSKSILTFYPSAILRHITVLKSASFDEFSARWIIDAIFKKRDI